MDILNTPEEYLAGTALGSVCTAEANRILCDGLGPDWMANFTFVADTIDADKAREIVAWEKAHANDVL